MGAKFWVLRFLTVVAIAFFVIFAAQLVETNDFKYSAVQASIWSVASSILVTRIYRSRQGQHCAMCKDTPEMSARERNSTDVS